MPDYQAMYAVLFQKITAAIEELQNAQCQTEEIYMSVQPPAIRVVDTIEMEDHAPRDKIWCPPLSRQIFD